MQRKRDLENRATLLHNTAPDWVVAGVRTRGHESRYVASLMGAGVDGSPTERRSFAWGGQGVPPGAGIVDATTACRLGPEPRACFLIQHPTNAGSYLPIEQSIGGAHHRSLLPHHEFSASRTAKYLSVERRRH
jgi:hypothetical protein